jgi:hypothetical protein
MELIRALVPAMTLLVSAAMCGQARSYSLGKWPRTIAASPPAGDMRAR